ncbi:MAG: hypothetical protein RLZZ458_844, partial [Planctomycetota bacterium]
MALVYAAGKPLSIKRKNPVKTLGFFALHSNGLEPLTFGSVVPQGFLLR